MASTAEDLSSHPGFVARQVGSEDAEMPLDQSPTPAEGTPEVGDVTPSRPQPVPLSVGVDDLQQYVVQDNLGAVYGVGRTVQEAVQDFYEALRARLSLLGRREEALDPKLARQLEQLRALFPDQT